jgi:hypothetical protein
MKFVNEKKKHMGRNYGTCSSSHTHIHTHTSVCILKLARTTGRMKRHGLFLLQINCQVSITFVWYFKELLNRAQNSE